MTGPLPVLVLDRYDCERAVLAVGVERAVEDLDAALAFVAARPWADPTRLLLGGMSRGGLLAVLYPSRRAVAARGVVNFAGGWTVERCDGRTRFNEDTFAEAGRTGRLPMFWLYSENARNYGPAAVRGYHQGFVRAGGAATLEMFPPIGHDGHILPPGESPRLADRRERLPDAARPRRATRHPVRAQIV